MAVPCAPPALHVLRSGRPGMVCATAANQLRTSWPAFLLLLIYCLFFVARQKHYATVPRLGVCVVAQIVLCVFSTAPIWVGLAEADLIAKVGDSLDLVGA